MTESDADLVHFVAGGEVGTGFTPHRGTGDSLTRRLDELQDDWAHVVAQIKAMIASAETSGSAGGLQISEVSVGLAFSAKGRLAFIAEAGVEATVTVTLSRALVPRD